MTALAATVSAVALLLAALPRIPVRSRRTLWLLLPNYFATAWAHYVAAAGLLGGALGLIAGAPVVATLGAAAAVLAADYVWGVTAPRDRAFERGLGASWRGRIARDAELRMLQHRWGWRVPKAPPARVSRDVVFGRLSEGRLLLCDVWEPPAGVYRSGLAVVHLHGSAWYLLDKDVGTRPLFGHLAAQGHVVVDVAYRLCPETDGVGMVADAKRAVAWLKEHAADYGVRRDRVVLMGSSAGGHLALLAAYSAGDPALTPDELRGADTSVAAVVSYYGVPDLRAFDDFARPFLPPGPLVAAPRVPPSPRAARWWRRLFGASLPLHALPPPPPHATLLRELAGGLADEVPERFDLLSPVHHVSRECPPTLHFQPEYDHIVPVASGRALHRKLAAAGVPVVYVELPCALHAFDLMVPSLFAPAGQAALYDLERFLAWTAASPAAKPRAVTPGRAEAAARQ